MGNSFFMKWFNSKYDLYQGEAVLALRQSLLVVLGLNTAGCQVAYFLLPSRIVFQQLSIRSQVPQGGAFLTTYDVKSNLKWIPSLGMTDQANASQKGEFFAQSMCAKLASPQAAQPSIYFHF